MTTHSWCTHLSGVSSPELQYYSDKRTTSACLSAGGREGGRDWGENSSFNMAADKESEWIQPTWAPQPGSPYLPFPFFFLHPSTHPLRFGIANHPMCFLTGEAGDKERGVGRISNRSMLFIFYCIYFILSVYLSLCHYMNAWLLVFVHTNAGGLFACKCDKDG